MVLKEVNSEAAIVLELAAYTPGSVSVGPQRVKKNKKHLQGKHTEELHVEDGDNISIWSREI